MRTNDALRIVSKALTNMGIKDRWGEPVEGLCALGAALRELPPELRKHWEAIESQLSFAASLKNMQLSEDAASIYCQEALALINYATMKIIKRSIDRDILELSFCAREES